MKRIIALCAVLAVLSPAWVPVYAYGIRYSLQRKTWTTQQAQDMRALEAEAAKAMKTFQSKHHAGEHGRIY